jgi:hypothetical protein
VKTFAWKAASNALATEANKITLQEVEPPSPIPEAA